MRPYEIEHQIEHEAIENLFNNDHETLDDARKIALSVAEQTR